MKKGGAVMPKCVVFSERAFTSILVETQEKIRTETAMSGMLSRALILVQTQFSNLLTLNMIKTI